MGRKLPWKLCRMCNFSIVVCRCRSVRNSRLFCRIIGNKLSIPLGQMFFRAVLCNFFVCLGVLCGMKLKSDAGRFLMIVMCISGFVVSGFEHCIANMGIFVTAYCLVPGLSLGAMLKSMVVVTLGNMVGGALLLAWPLRKMSADK